MKENAGALIRWRFAPLLLVLAQSCLLLILSGCASAPPPQSFDPAPVYPAPPDKPRFIYERTLQNNEDVEKITGLERLKIMATGRAPQAQGLVKPYGVAVHQPFRQCLLS